MPQAAFIVCTLQKCCMCVVHLSHTVFLSLESPSLGGPMVISEQLGSPQVPSHKKMFDLDSQAPLIDWSAWFQPCFEIELADQIFTLLRKWKQYVVSIVDPENVSTNSAFVWVVWCDCWSPQGPIWLFECCLSFMGVVRPNLFVQYLERCTADS